jgi:type II secretory pathway predicted ATPase ExeA
MPTSTSTYPPGLRQLVDRSERVFPSYPLAAHYFPAASIEDARQRLSRAIERGDGPGLVIGTAGTGKSLLLQVMAAQLQDRFDVVLLACARVSTPRALIQAILFEMGLRYHAQDEGELRLSLLDHLLSVQECPEGLLMLVDEAQTLSPALLDELRVLTNLVRGGVPRVRLVLAGSAALDESLAEPELQSFSQRLSTRCYLSPLNREETTQFIRAHVGAAGAAPDDLFADSAWPAVFEVTDGVPRLINQLCDRALLIAHAQNQPRIERDVVEAAWADLQQLPTHWERTPVTRGTPSTTEVVEFGGLSSDDATRDSDQYTVGDPGELSDVSPQPVMPPEQTAVDPFAEKFDEEELVLDSFAAWEQIFHDQVPRVENRRDPGFATLVQTALDASPGFGRPPMSPAFKIVPTHSSLETSPQHASGTLAFESEPGDGSDSAFPTDDVSGDENWSHWPSELCPPLRLADVSDTGPLTPDPRINQKSLPGAVAYDTQPYPAAGRASDWIAQVTIDTPTERSSQRSEVTTLTGREWEESPVLVIDDASPQVPNSEKPTVRRAEYSDLFSRLRGD